MTGKTSFFQYMKSFFEINIHHMIHRGHIKLKMYRDITTFDIFKQEYSCVCGKKWQIDYGFNEIGDIEN